MPDGGANQPPAGGLARSLLAEWHAALQGLDLDDVRLLARHGLNLPLLVGLGLDAYATMVGVLPMRVEGRRWWPDDTGERGFLSPVRSRGTPWDLLADGIVIDGPLIDLVAWHPKTPRQWATRAGIAEWLGAWDPGITYERTEPVRVWRAPFAWLRAWMTGIVPLTTDRPAPYQLLADMPAIRAEDEAHARHVRRALQRPHPMPAVDWPEAEAA